MSSTAATAGVWGDRDQVRTYRVVIMGVSGCGKSTVGRALADALNVRFVEGDDLHSPRNVERMAAGIPLTDDDRQGWLRAVAAQLDDPSARAVGVVVSCSALKRAYRDRLREAAADVRFVFLHGDPAVLFDRLGSRTGHYMPPTLLQSQLDTLEPPGADEAPITIDITLARERIVAEALRQLRSRPA